MCFVSLQWELSFWDILLIDSISEVATEVVLTEHALIKDIENIGVDDLPKGTVTMKVLQLLLQI